jgi:DNA-binding transcriptional ArsR family regulator
MLLSPLSVPEFAQVFKILGEEIRLRLLLLLAEEGPMSVSCLCEGVTQPQTTVSHHLMLMRMANLVGFRRVGKNNLYFISSEYALDLLRGIRPLPQEIPAGESANASIALQSAHAPTQNARTAVAKGKC